jgi:hypothetical protein
MLMDSPPPNSRLEFFEDSTGFGTLLKIQYKKKTIHLQRAFFKEFDLRTLASLYCIPHLDATLLEDLARETCYTFSWAKSFFEQTKRKARCMGVYEKKNDSLGRFKLNCLMRPSYRSMEAARSSSSASASSVSCNRSADDLGHRKVCDQEMQWGSLRMGERSGRRSADNRKVLAFW